MSFRRVPPICIIGCLGFASSATSLELVGRYGYIGEWRMRGKLQEVPSGSLFYKEFAGQLEMKHAASCMPGEVEDKTGAIKLRRRLGSSKVTATLVFDGVECKFNGPLSQTQYSILECGAEPRVPLYLWAP